MDIQKWLEKYYAERPQIKAPERNILNYSIPLEFRAPMEKLFSELSALKEEAERLRKELSVGVVSQKIVSRTLQPGDESSWRGHEIVWTGEQWNYKDTGQPTPGAGGVVRPCGVCGQVEWSGGPDQNYPDKCLGMLPGVTNACCGHGDRKESYVVFSTGVVLRGFVVENGELVVNDIDSPCGGGV